MHFAARRQRLDQSPFRAGEILEPVREHRPAVPRFQVAREAIDGGASERVTIPEPEPVELGAVGAGDGADLARQIALVQKRRAHLADRDAERLRVPGERARRHLRTLARRPSHEQRTTGTRDERPARVATSNVLLDQVLEEPVERRDSPADRDRLHASGDRARQARRPPGSAR